MKPGIFILCLSIIFLAAGIARLLMWRRTKHTWKQAAGKVVAFYHQESIRDPVRRVYGLLPPISRKLSYRDYYSPIIQYHFAGQDYEAVLWLRTPEALAFKIGDPIMVYIHPNDNNQIEFGDTAIKKLQPLMLIIIAIIGLISSFVLMYVGDI